MEYSKNCLTQPDREKGKAELDAFTENLLAQVNPEDRSQNAGLFRLAYFAVRAYTEHFPYNEVAHCNDVFPKRLEAYVSELPVDERERALEVLFDFCVDKRIMVRCCNGFPQVHGNEYQKYSFTNGNEDENGKKREVWIPLRRGNITRKLRALGTITHGFCPECLEYGFPGL